MKIKRWIPKNLKKDRVRNYLKRKYGSVAFDKNGNIKVSYINKALKKAKDKSLNKALNLAKRFKKM